MENEERQGRYEVDWVVGHGCDEGDLAYAMECQRCGVIQRVRTPLFVDGYVAMANAFIEQHSTCKPNGPAGSDGG